MWNVPYLSLLEAWLAHKCACRQNRRLGCVGVAQHLIFLQQRSCCCRSAKMSSGLAGRTSWPAGFPQRVRFTATRGPGGNVRGPESGPVPSPALGARARPRPAGDAHEGQRRSPRPPSGRVHNPNKWKNRGEDDPKRRLFGFGLRENRTSGISGSFFAAKRRLFGFRGLLGGGGGVQNPNKRKNRGEDSLKRRLFGFRRNETRTNGVSRQMTAKNAVCSGSSDRSGAASSLVDDSSCGAAHNFGHVGYFRRYAISLCASLQCINLSQ